jgi:hypothetical protein
MRHNPNPKTNLPLISGAVVCVDDEEMPLNPIKFQYCQRALRFRNFFHNHGASSHLLELSNNHNVFVAQNRYFTLGSSSGQIYPLEDPTLPMASSILLMLQGTCLVYFDGRSFPGADDN